MTVHKYVTPNSFKYKFFVELPDDTGKTARVLVQFDEHIFVTEDDALAAVIDALLAKGSTISKHVKKLDKAAAEAAIAKQLAEARRPKAVKGSMTSEAARQAHMLHVRGQTRNADIAALQAMADAVDGDMAVQVPVEPPPATESDTKSDTPIERNAFAAMLKEDA